MIPFTFKTKIWYLYLLYMSKNIQNQSQDKNVHGQVMSASIYNTSLKLVWKLSDGGCLRCLHFLWKANSGKTSFTKIKYSFYMVSGKKE